MKKKLNSITIVLCCIVFLGCYPVNKREDFVDYHRFNKNDLDVLITYDYRIGEVLTYRNQLGEEFHFKVLVNETNKKGYYSTGTFSGGGGDLVYYYDYKFIKLEILENQSQEEYSTVNYFFSKNGDEINSGINFPLWNIDAFGFIIDYNFKVNLFTKGYNSENRIQMDINGQSYDNIIIIKSNSNDVKETLSFGTLPQDVSIIYYDYEFGIVQFENVDGLIWKVIHP